MFLNFYWNTNMLFWFRREFFCFCPNGHRIYTFMYVQSNGLSNSSCVIKKTSTFSVPLMSHVVGCQMRPKQWRFSRSKSCRKCSMPSMHIAYCTCRYEMVVDHVNMLKSCIHLCRIGSTRAIKLFATFSRLFGSRSFCVHFFPYCNVCAVNATMTLMANCAVVCRRQSTVRTCEWGGRGWSAFSLAFVRLSFFVLSALYLVLSTVFVAVSVYGDGEGGDCAGVAADNADLMWLQYLDRVIFPLPLDCHLSRCDVLWSFYCQR